MAAKLNNLGIDGNGGTDGITGIMTLSGVTENAVGGTAAWSHWLDSMAVLQIANHEPNGIVMHPTDRTTMAKLAIDTNNYAVPPDDILRLPRLSTSAISPAAVRTLAVAGFFLDGTRTWGVTVTCTAPHQEVH